jgi:translation initiation factor 5
MACGAKDMVDMNHKLCNYILAQDKKAKKDAKSKGKKDKDKDKKKKDKKKDDSDEDKKKKKDKDKKKDSKKDKKKDKKKDPKDDDDDKGYLKEAMFGKKDEDEFSDEDDSTSVVSEAGVDDEGALSK